MRGDFRAGRFCLLAPQLGVLSSTRSCGGMPKRCSSSIPEQPRIIKPSISLQVPSFQVIHKQLHMTPITHFPSSVSGRPQPPRQSPRDSPHLIKASFELLFDAGTIAECAYINFDSSSVMPCALPKIFRLESLPC